MAAAVIIATMEIFTFPRQLWGYFCCYGHHGSHEDALITMSNHGDTLVTITIVNSWLSWQPLRYLVATGGDMKMYLKAVEYVNFEAHN